MSFRKRTSFSGTSGRISRSARISRHGLSPSRATRGWTLRKVYKRNAWLVFDDELLDRIVEEFSEERETVCSKHQALSQCLSKMRKDDLNLLRHRYMSNVKLEVYAARVNRSVAALKVKLHKLRNKLRLCIEERLKAETEE